MGKDLAKDMAGTPVEVRPDELLLAFRLQQHATFKAVIRASVKLDPQSCRGPREEICQILPVTNGSPHEQA